MAAIDDYTVVQEVGGTAATVHYDRRFEEQLAEHIVQ